MEARHIFYFCVFMLLLSWKGCVISLKCYVCNDCNEIREEYIETCDTTMTTVEPENSTVSTEAGNDQTSTAYDETTTEPIQEENTDVTTEVPTIDTQTGSEITTSAVTEATESEPTTSTQTPEIDDNDVLFHYRAEINKTFINNDDDVIINNDFDAPSQIYVNDGSLNPRCILTSYKGNDSDNEVTVRGCSFESDDDEARCGETIGLFGVELKSCMLCHRDLCNAAYFGSYHFAIIISAVILNLVN